MADRGDVGLVFKLGLVSISRSNLTLSVQPTGNGPISNSAPYVADAFSTINLNGFRGAQMDRVAKASAGGIWSFYDLSPGTYFATQAGVSRQWQIVVADDLTFTVTAITSSFPINTSCIALA